MWRWALAIPAALLAATVRAQAGAALESVLSVRADAGGCVSEGALRKRVERWLEPGPLKSGVEIAVDASSEPVSFALRRDGREVARRSFDVLPRRCDDRLDALALAIALTLEREAGASLVSSAPGNEAASAVSGANATRAGEEPAKAESETAQPAPKADAAAEPKPVTPAPAPSTATPATSEATASGDAEQPRGRSRDLILRLQAGAAYLYQAVPAPAVAGSVGAELAFGAWSLGLSGLLSLAASSSHDGVSARSQLLGGRMLGCYEADLSPVALSACAGAAGGAVLASGRTSLPLSNQDTTVYWIAAVLRAGVRVPSQGPVSVRLSADGLGNFLRPQLEVVQGTQRSKTTVFPLGLAGSLDLLIALP